jgi:hypothetical protein
MNVLNLLNNLSNLPNTCRQAGTKLTKPFKPLHHPFLIGADITVLHLEQVRLCSSE